MKKEMDFIELWAKYILENSNWRRVHNKFINSQIISANEKLKKLPEKKLIELFNIKNKSAIKKIKE